MINYIQLRISNFILIALNSSFMYCSELFVLKILRKFEVKKFFYVYGLFMFWGLFMLLHLTFVLLLWFAMNIVDDLR